MKRILTATTILAALGSPAFATGYNDINIDATGTTGNTGSVTSLSITQDSSGSSNLVSGETTPGTADKTVALPVRGAWNSIAITQGGSNNTLSGSLKTASVKGTTVASLLASYTGGNNVHSLNVGTTAAPLDPTISITVHNTGSGTNTITDTLNSGTSGSTPTAGSLSYTLGITGTGNSVTNTLTTTTGISLTEAITGDNNTLTNTTATGSSVSTATINQTILSSGNTVENDYTANATGTQNSTLYVDGASVVKYLSSSDGANQATDVGLYGAAGAASAQAQVVVLQSSAATGATANLNYYGNGYTSGTQTALGSGPASGYTPAVYISQNSPGALLNASVTAANTGYTVNIKQ